MIQEKQVFYESFASLGGAARGGVTPSSIPNLEVKPSIADNTAGYAGGNVGQCHLESLIIPYLLYFTFYSLNYFNVMFYLLFYFSFILFYSL